MLPETQRSAEKVNGKKKVQISAVVTTNMKPNTSLLYMMCIIIIDHPRDFKTFKSLGLLEAPVF